MRILNMVKNSVYETTQRSPRLCHPVVLTPNMTFESQNNSKKIKLATRSQAALVTIKESRVAPRIRIVS